MGERSSGCLRLASLEGMLCPALQAARLLESSRNVEYCTWGSPQRAIARELVAEKKTRLRKERKPVRNEPQQRVERFFVHIEI